MPDGDDRARQILIQNLILEFLERHPEPTPAHVDSLCSQHPDLANLLRELLPRVRGLTAEQTREQIDGLLAGDTLVSDSTLVSGEPQPAPAKAWVPGEETLADATLPAAEAKPLFDGRYRIIRTLGVGGFGRVELVEDTLRNDERVALKVILLKHQNTREFELRFQNEISVLRALRHKGIPQIFNDGRTTEGEFYYTMEFVEGTPLEDVLVREKRLGPQRIVTLVRQITNILEYAHSQGVVHRDLKPNNVILTNPGKDDEQARVLDFGIAKILRKEGMLGAAQTMDTLAGMGTPHYMSPEQVRGKEVDGRTDFYALGVIIYRMVSSRFPFKGKSPMEIATTRIENDAPPLEVDKESTNELTTQLATLVKGLLEREKEKRPDADAIRKHLVLEGMAHQQRRFQRFGRRVVALAAAAIVLIVGYFAWQFAGGSTGRSNGQADSEGSRGAAGPGAGSDATAGLPAGPGPAARLLAVDGVVSSPFKLTGSARNVERVKLVWEDGEQELVVDATGKFAGDVQFSDGEHDLRLLDREGNELDTLALSVDGTPPELEFEEPPPPAGAGPRLVHQMVEIRGSVRDAGLGALADLKVNSRPITVGTDGSFAYSLFERVGMIDQTQAVVFVARDGAGNTTEARFDFKYDGADPEIHFDLQGEVWIGSKAITTATDELQLVVEIVDSQALGLFLGDQELTTEAGKATVTLSLGAEHERSFHFRATDVSGRESLAELTLSRRLALTALTVDGDESALKKPGFTTPHDTLAVAGSLNRPAQEVGISLGSAAPVAATLDDSGTGFEAELTLVEGLTEELRLWLDGSEAGSWSVTWEPPRVPAGLVRIGTDGLDGRAKYARHEASGMQFVLVPAPERPYVYGDVQIALDRPYYIGLTEVTTSQFTASGLDFEEQRFWTKIDDPSSYPMAGVSFATAVEYCEWLAAGTQTVRLASEAEWLHAAGGPDVPAYPWGEEWDDTRCHSRYANERHPVAVTRYSDSAAWSGARGFAGNVSEWCTKADGSAVLRGGSWATGAEDCQLTERPAFRGEGGKNTVGLRVVIVPD